MYGRDGHDRPTRHSEESRHFVRLLIGERIAQDWGLERIEEELFDRAKESIYRVVNEFDRETEMAVARRIIKHEMCRAYQMLMPNQ